MKKYLALLLAVLMLAAVFTGCASKETTTDTPAASTDTAEPAKTDENTAAEETPAAEPASEEGKVFNIYAWNEEFKGFFEKYYTVPEGVTVNWIITAPMAPIRTSSTRLFSIRRTLLPTTRSTCSSLRPTTSRSIPSLPSRRTSPPSA